MIEEIKLFFFILSIVYTIRFPLEFLIKLFVIPDPKPLLISKEEKYLLYFTISYIITYIII
jgi:hypothetical protein